VDTKVPKPNLASTTFGNIFGNSFADFGGTNIDEGRPKGELHGPDLNATKLSDDLEFGEFEESIKDYVLGQLGHPVVRVELTSFQLKTCLDEAFNRLSYHAPLFCLQAVAFDASAGLNIYEIPPYILHNLEYVVYKKTLLSIQSLAGTLEFDFFIKYFQDNFLFQNFGVGDFFLLQQHLEQIRKVLGQEGSWNVLNNNFLLIAPSPVVTPQPVIIMYRAVDTETIHPAYRNWIQRYALACAKGVLGQIRGKYNTLPSPAGGASLNGAQLVEEGIKEKEVLMKELISEIEEPPAFTAF